MSGLHISPREPDPPRIRAVLRAALDALLFLALGAAIAAALIHILLDGWR